MRYFNFKCVLAFLIAVSADNVLGGSKGNLLKGSRVEQVYKITTTWDNDSLPIGQEITVRLSSSIDSPSNVEQLILSVEAPFYDDPHIPDSMPNETMWELWNYEVVELFLLGSDDHYLEIEVAPKGQYLLLELKGYRNAIRTKLPLYKDNYVAQINTTTKRWTGRAVIPNCYLPPNISKFNAFAIHGTDPNRIYKSLFPTKKGQFVEPNFHRLEFFGPIDFKTILPGYSSGSTLANLSFLAFLVSILFVHKLL